MSSTLEEIPEAAATITAAPAKRSHKLGGHWIDDWRPEDVSFWESTGKKVARRNLFFSIFAEHIGFSVWVLWSVFVLFLPAGQYGLSTDAIEVAGQKFLLTSLPAALGSFVRIPYTLAVARFGGRNWTIVSALTLLIPTVSAAFFLKPEAHFSTLLVLAAITGVGGGNFASSMTNINAFYPQRLKGWALGLNAGGGNLGVAMVQLVGLLVLSTAGYQHPRLMLAIYIPLIVVAAVGAYFTMDNLTAAKNEKRAMRDVTKDKHTWVMSFLYIGTFGSFIGFGFAFGQVLSTQFPTHFDPQTNKLSEVSNTRTPISDWLYGSGWFKDAKGKSYFVTGALDSTGTPVAGFKAHTVSATDISGCVLSGPNMDLTAPATADKPKYFHLTAKDLKTPFVPGKTDPSLGKVVTIPGTTTVSPARSVLCVDKANPGQKLVLLSAKLNGKYNPPTSAAEFSSPDFKLQAVAIGHKPNPVQIAWLVFLGPLIGSLIRPIGGKLADKFGGAKTTLVNFAAMIAAASLVLAASLAKSLPVFMVGFVALFIFAGIGNGSTYKMIPTIFRSKAQLAVAAGADPIEADRNALRLSGALIGIAGAIGAFGGVLVNIAFRQSFLTYKNGNGAYIAFIAFYVACFAVTWFFYLRKSPKKLAGV